MKCKKCGNSMAPDALFCTKCGWKREEEVSTDSDRQLEQKPVRRNYFVQIIFGVAILLVICFGIFVGVRFFRGMNKDQSKQIVFIKDNKLLYMQNMEKDEEPICITRIKGNDDSWNPLFLSEDGKYVYFYSKVDDYDGGTLCYAELERVGKDEDKNEKYIHEIDTKVNGNFKIIGDREIVYMKDNHKLFYYNGKNSKKVVENSIASDVVNFYYNSTRKQLLYTKNNDSTCNLYYYDFNKDESEKIDSDIGNGFDEYQDNCIFYCKYNNDKTQLMYVDAEGNTEEIDSDIAYVLDSDEESNCVYFTKQKTETKSLYEFVNDTYAESDMNAVEPQRKDYFIEVPEEEAIGAEAYAYYQQYPEKKANDISQLYFDYDEGMYYNYNNYQDYYYDESIDKWYECDEENYLNAVDAYYMDMDRINLREELKSQTIDIYSEDIYCFKDGKVTKIAEGASGYAYDVNIKKQFLHYAKRDTNVEKLDISNVAYADELRDWVNEQLDNVDSMKQYDLLNGKEIEVDDGIQLQSRGFSEDGKYVVGTENAGDEQTAYLYTLKEGKLTDKKKLADDYYTCVWKGNTLYYYVYSDKESGKQDIYRMENGKGKKLLSDVEPYALSIYEDDEMILWDNISDEQNCKLYFYDAKNEKVKIDNDVQQYSYINKDCIVYMKDDNLYVYVGNEENKRIAKEVTQYLCREKIREYLLY